MIVESAELLADSAAHAPHTGVLSVEEEAVIEDQVHVVNELFRPLVVAALQAVLDSAEIHRILNDARVVW